MRNNWPETVDELLAECKALEDRDLYTLGEKGEPYYGEDEPRVDGTEYLAGEYQYGIMMIPAQWVTHVISDATLGAGTCKLDGYTDAAFRVVQAADETDFIDYAEVCECTACGASVIVPHEYERVLCERDELWPTYNYCPHCGAKVVGE